LAFYLCSPNATVLVLVASLLSL